ncbi:MAG: hypothetical protein ACTHNE_10530 [Dyella sp.]|uniref:hypothetical protein n=1 Tax=Dyella sp. TaxID=1869338 RepID=UPI003F80D632
MRAIRFIPKLVSVVLGCVWVLPAAAQSTGPVQFDVTESALVGTVSCNGGQATAVTPVDASTTDVSGSNDAKASNLSAQACGLPLYMITSADDSTSAQDTTSEDDGDGDSTLQNVSLLGGLLTYQSKIETDACNAVSASAVTCQDTTSVQNLVFAGRHLTGTFTAPATFGATNASVQIPDYCTGLALFTGTLTVAGTSVQISGNTATVKMVPVALKGTLTCVGLPLDRMSVELKDESLVSIDDISVSNNILANALTNVQIISQR